MEIFLDQAVEVHRQCCVAAHSKGCQSGATDASNLFQLHNFMCPLYTVASETITVLQELMSASPSFSNRDLRHKLRKLQVIL